MEGAISNYCTPPCTAALRCVLCQALCRVFVTKQRNETAHSDGDHQIQVRTGQYKVQGTVLHYARQQADHEVPEYELV